MENVDQHLSDMQSAIGRILKIIEGLKNFTRKANPEERNEIDINTCIASALKLSETTMRKSSITLRQQLADKLPKIRANQGQLEQVLLNLIINAIQAIDHESGRIDISSYARAGDTMVCIAVSDNGRGIDPQLHDKIFDPFVTDRQSSGGTGLGLAIAYNLINEHGGKIEFSSKKAQGTTFRILLPTVLQKETVKVLIADDEVSMRTSVEKALSRNSRFITETASNGYQACIKLGAFRPDILILDLMMPEMNGLEVCRIIKAEPALAGVDVFIMTGYVQSQLLDEIRAIGFTTIINKPFRLPDLVRMIEEAADRKKDSRLKG
jgi:CheY-like chemotaxis protein